VDAAPDTPLRAAPARAALAAGGIGAEAAAVLDLLEETRLAGEAFTARFLQTPQRTKSVKNPP